jgi:hypothetical protein
VVELLVEALCYKPEGHEFYSLLGPWSFQLAKYFEPHCDPGGGSIQPLTETIVRNITGGKDSRYVMLAYLAPSVKRLP